MSTTSSNGRLATGVCEYVYVYACVCVYVSWGRVNLWYSKPSVCGDPIPNCKRAMDLIITEEK